MPEHIHGNLVIPRKSGMLAEDGTECNAQEQ